MFRYRGNAFPARQRFYPFNNYRFSISFILLQNNKPKPITKNIHNFRTLFLLDTTYQFDVYQFIPRTFTITTKNGSSQFNYEMLKKVSQTIFKESQTHPDILEYNLDFSDEGNVLEKFAQLFQGKSVLFTEENLPVSYKIVRTLQISNIPDFLKPYNLRTGTDQVSPKIFLTSKEIEKQKKEEEKEIEKDVIIDQDDFNNFISQDSTHNFTIVTKKKEYKCKLYSVYSSHVIRDFLKTNPGADRFEYQFDDEYGEFENICKLFNFERVTITRDNMETLNKIIEDLKIAYLVEPMNNFTENFDKMTEQFDDKQEQFEEIEETFYYLYNLNKQNIDEIKDEILENKNFEKEEEVSELAAYIFQVIKTDNSHHNELFELLDGIDKNCKDGSQLKKLFNQVIKQLLYLLGINKSVCSFIYKLYKNGYIQKEELFKGIKDFYTNNRYQIDQCFYPYEFSSRSYFDRNDYIPVWFLPELKEMKDEKKNEDIKKKENSVVDIYLSQLYVSKKRPSGEFMKSFWPDKLDLFKQIRDFEKPCDDLTLALINDDVDKLQSILSQRPVKKGENNYAPYNMFDNFASSGQICFIDYAAAYGSLKCFKYLMLNHHEITNLTFEYSITGGNIEIIKIVDQQLPDKDNFEQSISIAISRHQNDLFDWLFDQKFASNINNSDIKLLDSLVECSVKNGNAHSLIEIIDKGYNLSSKFSKMMNYAAANGFYKIAKIMSEIVPKEEQKLTFTGIKSDSNSVLFTYIPCVSFGNPSLLNLFFDEINSKNLQHIYQYAVNNEYMSIITYIENLPEDTFKLTNQAFSSNLLFTALDDSMNLKTNEIFDHLISLFNKNSVVLQCNLREFQFDRLLEKACKLKRNEFAKKIIELLISNFPKKDFSSAFIQSVSLNLTDVCKFLLESKVIIDYDTVLSHFQKIGSVDEKTFSLFIDNIPRVLKQLFIDNTVNIAINNQNIHLIEYLLKEKADSSNSLIEAAKTNNIEVVNIVLKYIDPIFINNKSKEGTALCIACRNSNYDIVSRLLQIDDIDINQFGQDNMTALNIAIDKINVKIINLLLDFYGENLKNETDQLNKALKLILKLNSKDGNVKKSKFAEDSKKDDEKNKEQKPTDLIPIFKKILKVENIDLNCCAGDYTLLSFASEINDIEIVEFLLKSKKVNINLTGPNNGNTALMNSIKYQNYEISKILLKEPNIDINLCNYEKETSLIYAVENESIEIIDLLIKHDKFNASKSFLNYAFYISTLEISKKLISLESLDVNYMCKNRKSKILFRTKLINAVVKYNPNKHTQKEEPPQDNIKEKTYDEINDDIFFQIPTKTIDKAASLEYLNKEIVDDDLDESQIMEIIDLIINHPSFDKEKSLAKFALFEATSQNVSLDIFKKLFSIFDNNVNIINEDGNCLLTSAVQNNNEDLINFILNDSKFDCNENEILYAFILSEDTPPIRKIIFDYMKEHIKDIDFNRILPNGDPPPQINFK